jgi:hypothetical protein
MAVSARPMSGINEVADFCSWYVSDMPRWQVEVCFGEKSGRRLLASGSSHFDPRADLASQAGSNSWP